MIIDVKRLLGGEMLITSERGETEVVRDFHPYVYAVLGHELPLGFKSNWCRIEIDSEQGKRLN